MDAAMAAPNEVDSTISGRSMLIPGSKSIMLSRFQNNAMIRSQFHQHFKSSFCSYILALKSINLKCNYKKAAHKNRFEKAARKMLVKLTLGNWTSLTWFNLVVWIWANFATARTALKMKLVLKKVKNHSQIIISFH
jgi:hypothetical protein